MRYRSHMPTKQRDTLVSTFRAGAMVDGLWVRTESCENDHAAWAVIAYVVRDDGSDEGAIVWDSGPLWGPARDLAMMVHHMRGAAASRAADIIEGRASR